MQLDVTSSQLLVTDRDFKDPSFGDQLRETVFALLNLKVIPLFNENDAISTRRQSDEVCFINCFCTAIHQPSNLITVGP